MRRTIALIMFLLGIIVRNAESGLAAIVVLSIICALWVDWITHDSGWR